MLTSRSWRAGVKLVHNDLGLSFTGDRRHCSDSSAGYRCDKQDDDEDGDDHQLQQQNKVKSNELLQTLVTVTAGITLQTTLYALQELSLASVASATLAQLLGTLYHPHLRTITDTNAFKRHIKLFLFTVTFS